MNIRDNAAVDLAFPLSTPDHSPAGRGGSTVFGGRGVRATAEANQVNDDFVAALSKAGVHYGDPGNAVALGQSVCPMLAKPGGTLAAVSKVEGGGISAEMAGMFAQIAIQMYCPQVMGDLASGNLSGLPKIPGVPGI